jgi:hypothetical protein
MEQALTPYTLLASKRHYWIGGSSKYPEPKDGVNALTIRS